MILIFGEHSIHYTVNYNEDNTFTFSRQPNYFLCIVNNVFGFKTNGNAIVFYIKNNKLVTKINDIEFYFCFLKDFFLSSDPTNFVEFKLSITDRKFITSGANSYIYDNFVDDDKDYYCRVSYDNSYGFITEEIENTMKDYCLVPTIVNECFGIIIEKVKKAIPFKTFLNNITKDNFHKRLRYLVEAVNFMNINNIVHGDISVDNIVELNGKILLIDIDGMFKTTDDLSRTLIGKTYIFTVPSFVTKIVLNSLNIKCEKNNNVLNLEYLEKAVRYKKIFKLFKDIVEKNYRTSIKYTLEEALHYLNVYQVVKTIFVIVCLFDIYGYIDLYNDKVINFFIVCLDVKKKRIISSEELLKLYDEVFLT